MAVSFALSDIRFRYDPKSELALEIPALSIPGDCTVALLGPSGSGKSTLLNLLGLLRDPSSFGGDIAFECGGAFESWRGLSAEAARRLRLQALGYVLQSCYLLPNFSGIDNIAMPLGLQGWGRPASLARVRDLLERTGDRKLLDVANRRRGQFSLGQQQRIAVLRSIVHEPTVVFADEPTSNLDATSTRQMLDLLGDWRGGKYSDGAARPRQLILVCHQLELALERADHLILLDGDHRVAHSFARAEWPNYSDRVNLVLGSRVPADFGAA